MFDVLLTEPKYNPDHYAFGHVFDSDIETAKKLEHQSIYPNPDVKLLNETIIIF